MTGGTSAADFPLTANAFQTTTLAPPEGYTRGPSALYSTYFGGNQTNCIGGSACVGVFGNTAAYALTVGPSGAVAMAGNTSATDLPVTAGVLGPACNCTNLAPSAFLAESRRRDVAGIPG